jgi:Bacterial regulatory helix-turn-helix protein, lysR family
MDDRTFRDLNSKIDLNQLRYVVAAADCGSFSKAAEALNVRQSIPGTQRALSRNHLDLMETSRAHRRDHAGFAIPHALLYGSG